MAVVNTLVDEFDGSVVDGDVSLRDAIAATSTLDPIIFHPSLNGGTISLTLGELHIIAWHGTVARRGATRNTKGATIASEMSLRPIEPPEGDDIWRDSDGRRYSTQSLAAKCMALLQQQATAQ